MEEESSFGVDGCQVTLGGIVRPAFCCASLLPFQGRRDGMKSDWRRTMLKREVDAAGRFVLRIGCRETGQLYPSDGRHRNANSTLYERKPCLGILVFAVDSNECEEGLVCTSMLI